MYASGGFIRIPESTLDAKHMAAELVEVQRRLSPQHVGKADDANSYDCTINEQVFSVVTLTDLPADSVWPEHVGFSFYGIMKGTATPEDSGLLDKHLNAIQAHIDARVAAAMAKREQAAADAEETR